MKNRYAFDILLLVLLGFICLIVFFDFIRLEKIYLFKDIGSDTINAVYPHLIHVSEYLRTEGIPRWSFAQGLGQNITNSGIDNPFNWLLYVLGKDRLAYGIIFVEIIKILITAWLCYRWLLVLFKNHFAALFGALAFSLSAYMIIGGSWYVHSWLCFKVILLLWAFEKGYRKQIWLWWSLAVFWSFDVNFIFIGQFFLLYLLFRLTVQDDEYSLKKHPSDNKGFSFNQRTNTFFGLLKPLFAYSILGVLMKAPLIGSMYYRIWDSPRLQEEFSATKQLFDAPFIESAMHYATVVLRTLGNDLIGNGSNFLGWKNYLEAPLFYFGIVSLLLIPQAFVFMQKRERIAFGLLILFWILVITFPYLRYAYYWFSGDYYKIAVSVFFPLSCLLCTSRAIAAFQQNRKIHVPILIITAVILILSACFAQLGVQEIVDTYFFQSIVFIIIGTCVLLILHKNKFQHKWSFYSLILLLSFELLIVNYQTVNNRHAVTRAELQQRIGYNDYTLEAVEFIKTNDRDFFRLSKRYSSSLSKNRSLNDGKAQGFFGTSSYSSFNQGHYVNFLTKMGVINEGEESQSRWILGLHQRPDLEKLVGLKYVFGDASIKKNGMIGVGLFGDKTLFKKPESMPLGFIYTKFFPQESFLRLNNEQKDCAILNAVVIPEEIGKDKRSYMERFTQPMSDNCFPADINKMQLEYFSNNKLLFSGNNPGGIFFTSIPYDIGWQAMVTCGEQQEKASIINVNFGFIGIPLANTCNETKIMLQYHPPYARIGLIIALFAWSTLAFLFYRNRKKKLI